MTRAPVADPLREIASLTKRQREVLALAAKGMTNPAIGERLGISKDGAKWHIGEILMRLDVDTREEAVDRWRRYNGLPYRLHRVTRALMGPVALRWLIGGAGATAVAGLAVVLVVLALQRGDDSTKADTTPPGTVTATTTPPATSTPESIDGIPVVDAHVGGATSLPQGTVVYVVGGCSNCDGAPTSVSRAIMGIDGKATEKALYSVPTNGHSPGENGRYITSVAATTDARGLVIGVCTRGNCGPLNGISVDAQVAFYGSNDGGITWNSIGVVDGGARALWVEGADPTTVHALIEQTTVSSEGSSQEHYLLLPDKQSAALEKMSDGTTWIIGAPVNQQAVLASDGKTLIGVVSQSGVNPTLPAGAQLIGAWMSPGGFVVEWSMQSGGKTTTYLGRMGTDSHGMPKTSGKPQSAIRWPFGTGPFTGTFLNDTHAFVNVPVEEGAPSSAAILDIKTGAVAPLDGYFLTRAKTGDRSNVIAVAHGPFVAVQDTGDCLNVREAASTTAATLGCFKDGVLLGARGTTTETDGQKWLAVTTPLNSPGWAAAEYLSPLASDTSHDGSPAAGYRTGNPDIDPVLAAIESGDGQQILAVTQYTSETCVAEAHRIGEIECPKGVAGDSTIDVLPSGGCEGSAIPRTTFEAAPSVPGVGMELYAIYGSHDDGYVIMFTDPKTGLAQSVTAKDGHLVSAWGGCGQTPAQVIADRGITDFILAPK